MCSSARRWLAEQEQVRCREGRPQGAWGGAALGSAPASALCDIDGNGPGLGLRRLGQRQRQDALLQIGANTFLVNLLASSNCRKKLTSVYSRWRRSPGI